MQSHIPLTRELVLIGGGHTHALILRMWGMNPLPGVRVTVINPHPTAPYSGMLPGFVAGHYSRDQLDIDLVKLARFAGVRMIRGMADHIDTDAQTVTVSGGRVVPYHVASIDIGITSAMPELPGFSDHAVPAKPLDRFSALWANFRTTCIAGQQPANAAVIGGGIAGVELAMAMAHALHSDGNTSPPITLIDRANILPNMRNSHLRFFRKRLALAGISVLENVSITRVSKDQILLDGGQKIATSFVVGAAGTRAHSWLGNSRLELNDGFINVGATLKSTNVSNVFAAGDCAHLSHAPRPKAGVFAVREAPVLFANLRAALSGSDMQDFRPQADYLKLISMGGKSAFADKWGMRAHGTALWRLKNGIDIKFMKQFHDLEPMSLPKNPTPVALGVAEAQGDAPLCGGCGAKVSSVALSNTLSAITPPNRDDILSGPGDDAAILKGPAGSFQVITTDHLRAFINDPHLMARIAAIHALGDIWAMGAKPQSALANITLPRLSPELQETWLGEIMDAAGQVFSGQGAAIVGGHSSMGSELTIGFTLTGLCDQAPVGKGGAKPGDQLILTKPIGTGVIMAGEMVQKAHGAWVVAALNSMAQPQGDVSQALAGAHAMTDITGFGLAGHLAEIARASGVGITLNLNAVPVLNGAVELSEIGVRSSLYRENRALLPDHFAPDEPKANLLFDPQTAGGLLAAVAPEQVAKTLHDLDDLGCDAKVIGNCTDDPAGLNLI